MTSFAVKQTANDGHPPGCLSSPGRFLKRGVGAPRSNSQHLPPPAQSPKKDYMLIYAVFKFVKCRIFSLVATGATKSLTKSLNAQCSPDVKRNQEFLRLSL
uniref:Uncharacterized protein n=1 Tax=Sphaerodactylus townsendi TaxID=933632 RepID=A0ACB8FME0_9SAUR